MWRRLERAVPSYFDPLFEDLEMENEGQQDWITQRVCMDGLEATMDRIGYEQERGVERGDQVKNWTKVMPFWWAIIWWLVRRARRGVVVCVVEHAEIVGEGGTIIL